MLCLVVFFLFDGKQLVYIDKEGWFYLIDLQMLVICEVVYDCIGDGL